MYHKPFSLWKQECQAVYTTQDVADQGKQIGDISRLFLALFIITLVTYISVCLNQILYVFCGGADNCCHFIFIFLIGFVEIGGYIALIVVYSML